MRHEQRDDHRDSHGPEGDHRVLAEASQESSDSSVIGAAQSHYHGHWFMSTTTRNPKQRSDTKTKIDTRGNCLFFISSNFFIHHGRITPWHVNDTQYCCVPALVRQCLVSEYLWQPPEQKIRVCLASADSVS